MEELAVEVNQVMESAPINSVVKRKNFVIVFNTLLKEDKIGAYFIREVKDEKGENYFPFPIREHIVAIEKALNLIYSDEWSYSLNIKTDDKGTRIFYYLDIILHFPVIKITNGVKDNHIIRDLYVKFSILPMKERLLIKGLEGARATYTADELYKGYAHSHLTSRTSLRSASTENNYERILVEASKYSPFCLGAREPGSVNWLLDKLGTGFDIKRFKMFLIQIKGYVAWESLAGVPYIKMRTITSMSTKKNIQSVYFNDYSLYILLVKILHNPLFRLNISYNSNDFKMSNNRIDEQLSNILSGFTVSDALSSFISFDGNKFVVDINSKIFSVFALVVVRSYGTGYRSYVGFKDSNGLYYNVDRRNATIIPKNIVSNLSLISFKGKVVPATLISNAENSASLTQDVLPIVKHSIANALINVLTIYSIYKLKIKRKIFIELK